MIGPDGTPLDFANGFGGNSGGVSPRKGRGGAGGGGGGGSPRGRGGQGTIPLDENGVPLDFKVGQHGATAGDDVFRRRPGSRRASGPNGFGAGGDQGLVSRGPAGDGSYGPYSGSGGRGGPGGYGSGGGGGGGPGGGYGGMGARSGGRMDPNNPWATMNYDPVVTYATAPRPARSRAVIATASYTGHPILHLPRATSDLTDSVAAALRAAGHVGEMILLGDTGRPATR